MFYQEKHYKISDFNHQTLDLHKQHTIREALFAIYLTSATYYPTQNLHPHNVTHYEACQEKNYSSYDSKTSGKNTRISSEHFRFMLNPFISKKRYPNLQKMDKNALQQHLNTSYVNLTEMDVIYRKKSGNSYQQK